MEGLFQMRTGQYGGVIQNLVVTLVTLDFVLDAKVGNFDVAVRLFSHYLLVADCDVLSVFR